MLTPRQLFLIVFIEGFCSLGAEVLALRQLILHVGSSIVVTAPTIGFFLLALALGYAFGRAGNRTLWRGGGAEFSRFSLHRCRRPCGQQRRRDLCPSRLRSSLYGVFIAGVVCLLAWLLGQTVPVLTNLMRHERVGEKAGFALYWSTLGSFLGPVTLSPVVMQWLGVSAAVIVVATLLFAGALILQPKAYGLAGRARSVAHGCCQPASLGRRGNRLRDLCSRAGGR